MDKINIKEKFSQITEYWKPKIVAELNNQQVRLVKTKGEFVFHKHDDEDELFLVIKGNLKMVFEDRVENLKEGEFIIVPRRVVHKPVTEKEAHLLLFEPSSTLNTGNVKNERTVDSPERI
jgi:mannose-6-phosphate isomerase-like protein (cupin superfamily)